MWQAVSEGKSQLCPRVQLLCHLVGLVVCPPPLPLPMTRRFGRKVFKKAIRY